jgi:hypothetical protein
MSLVGTDDPPGKRRNTLYFRKVAEEKSQILPSPLTRPSPVQY